MGVSALKKSIRDKVRFFQLLEDIGYGLLTFNFVSIFQEKNIRLLPKLSVLQGFYLTSGAFEVFEKKQKK